MIRWLQYVEFTVLVNPVSSDSEGPRSTIGYCRMFNSVQVSPLTDGVVGGGGDFRDDSAEGHDESCRTTVAQNIQLLWGQTDFDCTIGQCRVSDRNSAC